MRPRGCCPPRSTSRRLGRWSATEPDAHQRRCHPFGHRRHRVHGDADRLKGSPVVTAPAPSRTDGQGGPSLTTAELELEGMHCSACATRIQRSLGRLPAVASASVNLATTRAFVSYDADRIGLEGLCQAVSDVGYSASPATPTVASHRARPRPLGPASGHLVAAGHCRCAGVGAGAGNPHGRLDRPGAGHHRRDRRRLALPAQQRPPPPTRRHQHGHPHRPGHAGRPGGQRGGGHRPGRPARAPGRERRLCRPTARCDVPVDRGHPGHRPGRRGQGTRQGVPGHALTSLPPSTHGTDGGHPRGRGRRAGFARDRAGRVLWCGSDPAKDSRSTAPW